MMTQPALPPSLDLTDDDALFTPAEVGAYFRVDAKTVSRWARAKKIGSIRTGGGHRRFRASEVKRLLRERADS
jgi:excisionase family DNA binding protein